MTHAVAFKTPVLTPPLQKIHDEAVASARKYLFAEADLLEKIIAVDRAELYRQFGEHYLTPYREKYLRLSPEVAANFVRVARKSIEVPALFLAESEGLCLSKARAIVPVITKENQAEWIVRAHSLPRSELEREVVKVNPLALKPEKARPVGANRNRIEYELSDEWFEKQKRARDILSGKLGRSVSLAELQEALLAEFLRRHDPVEKAERNAQKDQSWDSSSRAVPARVKHAVNRRDRGRCQAKLPNGEICGNSRWVHLHHIKPKSQGGADTPENLLTVCSSHHRLWHEMDTPRVAKL